MEEKRKIIQKEIYDEYGNLEYTIIPNYKVHDDFLTKNELKLYQTLLNILPELKEKYKLNLQIFAQVAVNRIIDVNNERKKDDLFYKICSKSIDFVLFNKSTNKIHCCIELDDITHLNEDRKKRDLLIDKIFKDNIKLVHIKTESYYQTQDIIKYIV